MTPTPLPPPLGLHKGRGCPDVSPLSFFYDNSRVLSRFTSILSSDGSPRQGPASESSDRRLQTLLRDPFCHVSTSTPSRSVSVLCLSVTTPGLPHLFCPGPPVTLRDLRSGPGSPEVPDPSFSHLHRLPPSPPTVPLHSPSLQSCDHVM